MDETAFSQVSSLGIYRVTLAYHRRATPLVWMWVRSSRGHKQQWPTIGFVGVYSSAAASRCQRIGPGRLGIWRSGCAQITGSMGLEVCFVSERQSFGP